MLNNGQIKLVQTAVRAAGLRESGQYYFVLKQYRQGDSKHKVTSCKQLNNWQMEDLLAICESLGWRHPGKGERFYRNRAAGRERFASFSQQKMLEYLAGDLGWNEYQLAGMIERMTAGDKISIAQLAPGEAHGLIEALKEMFGRQTGKKYKNLKEIQHDMEVTDGRQACKVG